MTIAYNTQMVTTWEYSLELEAKRLLHNAHQIAVGFYKINGFVVLPYESAKDLDNFVSFPNLPYLSIPRFWERAARLDVSTLPIEVPSDLLNETVELLKKANLPKPNYQKIQRVWRKHQNKVISQIYELIPSRKDTITKIVIWPTAFGTGGSFNQSKNPPEPVYIWLRQDRGISSLIECILTSITRPDVYRHLNGLWQESEIIVDWLLAYSPLYKLLKKLDKDVFETLTIKSTRVKQQADLLQKSESFLRQIGAPVINIEAVKQVSTQTFSPKEKEILNLLISKSPQIVTMDQIGDVMFQKNPDSYSLFAISKLIQRLRDKLEKNGVSGSFIQTKRGEGYLLIN